MNDRWDDDALLDSLRDALEHTEPAPANVDQVIDTAFSIMDVDEEIAELLDDSMVGASAMRGEDTARTLSFAAGSVQLELHREPGGSLTGQVFPPQPAEVLLQRRSSWSARSGATDEIEVDEHGRFLLPSHLVVFRVRVHVAGATPFWTPWTEL